MDGTGRDRMGRVRQPLFQGGATDEPVWLVCAVIRRFRRDFSACRAILHFDFGETVSFSCAKLYNCLRITEALSFGKDEGSANRRGAEPSVFSGIVRRSSGQRFCVFSDVNDKCAVLCENIASPGDWRSGSAGPLQGQGRRFKSCIAHHVCMKSFEQCLLGGLFCFRFSFRRVCVLRVLRARRNLGPQQGHTLTCAPVHPGFLQSGCARASFSFASFQAR